MSPDVAVQLHELGLLTNNTVPPECFEVASAARTHTASCTRVPRPQQLKAQLAAVPWPRGSTDGDAALVLSIAATSEQDLRDLYYRNGRHACTPAEAVSEQEGNTERLALRIMGPQTRPRMFHRGVRESTFYEEGIHEPSEAENLCTHQEGMQCTRSEAGLLYAHEGQGVLEHQVEVRRFIVSNNHPQFSREPSRNRIDTWPPCPTKR